MPEIFPLQTCQWEDFARGFPVPRAEQPRLNSGECLVNVLCSEGGSKERNDLSGSS